MDYNNEHTISMTAFIPSLSEDNKPAYRLSRTIRLLSFLDVFLGIFMLFFGNVGFVILVRLLCSISGYYGAKHYNKCLSLIYLGFIVLTTIGELFLMFVYRQEYNDGNITRDMLMVGTLYQFIFFFLKVYILRFISKFISLIRNLSVAAKTELMLYDSQPVEIVYW